MLHVTERNQDATLYVGGLDDQCSEAILWELFTQAGPVINVHMPKDRITGNHQGYGFVEFASEEDADYAMKVMNMVKLYGKPLRANKASSHQKNQDIGANIFIGNLDPDVDEKLLYDTFSAFGTMLQTPKVMRDYNSNTSRGFAFINYASFEASDAAIEAMNGQYFSNRPITVSYAFKKDAKGERHGTMIERLLAQRSQPAQSSKSNPISAMIGHPAAQAHSTIKAEAIQDIPVQPIIAQTAPIAPLMANPMTGIIDPLSQPLLPHVAPAMYTPLMMQPGMMAAVPPPPSPPPPPPDSPPPPPSPPPMEE